MKELSKKQIFEKELLEKILEIKPEFKVEDREFYAGKKGHTLTELKSQEFKKFYLNFWPLYHSIEETTKDIYKTWAIPLTRPFEDSWEGQGITLAEWNLSVYVMDDSKMKDLRDDKIYEYQLTKDKCIKFI